MRRILLVVMFFLLILDCMKKDDDKELLLGVAVLASQQQFSTTPSNQEVGEIEIEGVLTDANGNVLEDVEIEFTENVSGNTKSNSRFFSKIKTGTGGLFKTKLKVGNFIAKVSKAGSNIGSFALQITNSVFKVVEQTAVKITLRVAKVVSTGIDLAIELFGGSTSDGDSNCAGDTVTRNWGTFCDMKDGTVKLDVTDGTWGGNVYTAQTLYFAKCSHGQTYDSGGNTCSETGTATRVQYCSIQDQSCNDAGTGILNGNGTSTAYTACHDLNAGAGTYNKTNWRVPTKNELKLLIECTDTTTMPNDIGTCDSPRPSINNLFSNTVGNNYWSSTTYAPGITNAWVVSFFNGDVGYNGKATLYYVRCVSGP